MHGAKPNPHRQLGALQDGTGDQRCLIATAPALQQLTIADLAGCAPRTLEALRPAPGKPRPAAGRLIRIKPFEGIIREALLVLHAIARHLSYPENLRDFRMIILSRRLSVDGKRDRYYRTFDDPDHRTLDDPDYRTLDDPDYRTLDDPDYQDRRGFDDQGRRRFDN